MFKSIREWAQSVRYGSIQSRRRWFFGIVIVCFSLIVGLWALFLSPFSSGEDVLSKESSLFEFWSVFKTGFIVALNQIKESFPEKEYDTVTSGLLNTSTSTLENTAPPSVSPISSSSPLLSP